MTIIEKVDIYRCKNRFYFVGQNVSKNYYKILKLTVENIKEPEVIDDGVIYSKKEMDRLISDIASACPKPDQLVQIVQNCHGIIGFVRFTKGYYVCIIKRSKHVALLGGHYIYHIDETRLYPLFHKKESSIEEDGFLQVFQSVDLANNFYFSYTFDITNTLQMNMTSDNIELRSSYGPKLFKKLNTIFVWNFQLISNGKLMLGIDQSWMIPLIHGYVDQSRISFSGRDVFLTLIARRSRVFAGVRFMKRGINEKGYVANDVETEQIVHTMETTSFDTPYGYRNSNPNYTSFIKESIKREGILGDEFSECISYLNQFLPDEKKILYIKWDMSRAKKNREDDVLQILEEIAEESLAVTGFFHNGPELYGNYLKRTGRVLSNLDIFKSEKGSVKENIILEKESYYRREKKIQHGVVRSNCIDCLDRTNAAQSIIGKVAFAHQLYELGCLEQPLLPFETDAAMVIEEMYHDLGDTIALQYGGSHLVNTVQTYRKINNWTSHSRDLIVTLRRYYSNSFVDAERQKAITLFLEKSSLSENDSNLHLKLDSDDPFHSNDLANCFINTPRKNQALIPNLSKSLSNSSGISQSKDNEADKLSNGADHVNACEDSTDVKKFDYWEEYYLPNKYTSFNSLFVSNINSNSRYNTA
ncbi:hypothetical protein BB560_003256 [Smittium megazygosporum]|uniref:SAC domain-containing protein n=1 Tax=Smittium megazygosporum TaxID=133381 RepID=A0A2T9ZCG4_9FUNG|nr:hypothetical protein BB560_003256 [Smittium megazygosporum]